MLGLYTNFNNNTYLNQNYGNQNYGYGQSVMNPYQQQSSFFGGYQSVQNYGYAQNVMNPYQQQPACDMNSMLFSIINSLLPAMFGLLGNSQSVQRPVAQQPPVASTVPVTSNVINVVNGNSSQNNIFNTIINIILNSSSGKTPVTIDEETVEIVPKEPEKVFLIGAYNASGKTKLTLEDNIKDFFNSDSKARSTNGGPDPCYQGSAGHNKLSANDEQLKNLLGNLSESDKKLTLNKGEAYIITESGEIIGTASSTQIAGKDGFLNKSYVPTAQENSDFKIIEDIGIKNGAWSVASSEEATGGKISLNGTVYDVESSVVRKRTPLTFDLNGDGVKTSDKVISYDIDGDGKLDKINDVADGTLSIRGGKDGKDLFGDNTDLDGDDKADGFANGFEALKALAAKEGLINGKDDMKLDAKDLKILEDKYQLGMKTNGYNSKEKSLESLGITEINLGTAEVIKKENFDGRNNDILTQDGATFEINGKDREYADVLHEIK